MEIEVKAPLRPVTIDDIVIAKSQESLFGEEKQIMKEPEITRSEERRVGKEC